MGNSAATSGYQFPKRLLVKKMEIPDDDVELGSHINADVVSHIVSMSLASNVA